MNWKNSEIARIQQRFLDAGFQFNEHVFNDGHWRNCHISVTESQNPHAFRPVRAKTVGWGRFDRFDAWEMAEKWLDEKYNPEDVWELCCECGRNATTKVEDKYFCTFCEEEFAKHSSTLKN